MSSSSFDVASMADGSSERLAPLGISQLVKSTVSMTSPSEFFRLTLSPLLPSERLKSTS